MRTLRVPVRMYRIVRVFFMMWILGISACENKKEEPMSDAGVGAIVGVNYTGNGIQWFTLNGVSGSSLGTYSGGGGSLCCTSYPKIWTPGYTVKVKWERSDGREPSGTRWAVKTFEKVVVVEKYVEEGDVHVLFLPEDEVKVVVSVVGVGNPGFPSNPGYPSSAKWRK